MTEKKAVLNVTVDESLAEEVRRAAKLEHTTISSVVERALREQLSWELKRLEGIRAIDAYYQEHGYPTPEEGCGGQGAGGRGAPARGRGPRLQRGARHGSSPAAGLGRLMKQAVYDSGALIAIDATAMICRSRRHEADGCRR